MTLASPLAQEPLQYYATAAYPCSYLPDRVARSQVVAPADAIDVQAYSELVALGFRRSGAFIYRPHCDHCQACTSVRLPVARFEPSRSQRRAWSQHADLQVKIMPPTFIEEHYALYKLYQRVRHTGGGMDQDDVAQYHDFLVKTHVRSLLAEFRQPHPDGGPGELKMVSIVDQLDRGLSAVYTFFAPQPKQSFGTFNVLWQIRLAQQLGLEYLYLGYWIEQCQKMSYKTRFRPYEQFIKGHWIGI